MFVQNFVTIYPSESHTVALYDVFLPYNEHIHMVHMYREVVMFPNRNRAKTNDHICRDSIGTVTCQRPHD